MNIFNVIREPAAVIDRDGVIMQVNAAWSKGLDPAENPWLAPKGSQFIDFCKKAQKAEANLPIDQLVQEIEHLQSQEKQDAEIQYDFQTSTGQQFYSLRLIWMPEEQSILAYHLHLPTPAKPNNNFELEQSFSEKLLESAHSVIVGLDFEGNIIYFNREAELVTGYSKDQALGMNWFEKIISKEHYPKVWASFRSFAQTGVIREDSVNSIHTRDGEVRQISWRNQPLIRQNKVIGILSFGIDITKRKEALDQLKKSEENFRTLIQNIDIGVFLQGPDAKIIQENNKALELLGLTREQLIGRSSYDPEWQIIQEDGSHFPTHLRPVPVAMRTGKPVRNVVIGVFRPAKSDWIWLLVSAEPIKDEEGNLLYVVTSFRDITKQKIAEQDKLNNQAKLSAILENTDDKIWAVDKNYQLTVANTSFQTLSTQLSGRKLSFGENVLEHFHSDELRATWKVRYDKVLKGERILEEVYCDEESGTVFVELSLNPIMDPWGDVIGVSVFSRDITERRNREADLKLMQSTLDQVSDSIFLINKEAQIINVNQTACKLLGYSREELLNSSIDVINPDFMRSNNWDDHWKGLKKTKHQIIESEHVTKSGEVIPVEISLNYLELNGREYHFSFARDIRERKKSEEKMSLLNQELARHNNDLKQFTYITSHNLRSPVANILGLIDQLDLQNEDPELNEMIKENLVNSGKRLDTVLTDLNNLLNLRRGQKEMKEEVDLREIITNLKNHLQVEIENTGAKLSFDLGGVNQLHTIKSYIQSIFTNLISNALKYRSPDRAPEISLSTSLENDWVHFDFQDNGLGIDLNRHKNSLFGLYQRFHSHIEGKGLGLFMTKTQVEGLGGQISVDSEPDKGTRFRVSFRYKHQPKKLRVSQIWIIDPDSRSNKANQKILQKSLNNASISCFENSRVALEKLLMLTEEAPGQFPDLIFLNPNLSENRGWEFMEAYSDLPQALREKCHLVLLGSTQRTKELDPALSHQEVSGVTPKTLSREVLQELDHTLFESSTLMEFQAY